MALLDTGEKDGIERAARSGVLPGALPGVLPGALGVSAELVWLGWWCWTLPVNVLALVLFATELVGVLGTIAITVGLARARDPREVFLDDPRESRRFAFAVADVVGRTRSTDVHRDVRRVVRAMPHGRPRRSADAAMGAVLVEGPRRLVLVTAVTLALLLGVAPMRVPPVWALAALAVGVPLVALSHRRLSGGRIRFGDRTRWSYSSIGEVVGAADLDGLAPRRWVGTVAAITIVNLGVALRGTSDRWTHGLEPMPAGERVVTMAFAFVVVVGALFTLRTIETPIVDDSRRSRRLEERTARQSALGAAVAIGLIGLIAGVLPGSVDPADGDHVRIEHLVEREAGVVAE